MRILQNWGEGQRFFSGLIVLLEAKLRSGFLVYRDTLSCYNNSSELTTNQPR